MLYDIFPPATAGIGVFAGAKGSMEAAYNDAGHEGTFLAFKGCGLACGAYCCNPYNTNGPLVVATVTKCVNSVSIHELLLVPYRIIEAVLYLHTHESQTELSLTAG